MNHKELISSIASRMNLPKPEVERMMEETVAIFTENLSEGTAVGIQGFGSFELKKKEERISVHPVTQVRTLTPPKLVATFKQSSLLKEKLKELSHE